MIAQALYLGWWFTIVVNGGAVRIPIGPFDTRDRCESVRMPLGAGVAPGQTLLVTRCEPDRSSIKPLD